MRMLLAMLVGAALGLGTWLVVGSPFGGGPPTKAETERAVARRPRGHVQLVLCNERFVPSRAAESDPPQTWTCDTYLGPTRAAAQNGPSYEVIVHDERIASIRRVSTG